jgi:ribosome biogenesis GTPase
MSRTYRRSPDDVGRRKHAADSGSDLFRFVRGDGEWSLVHRCCGCHAVRVNRIAGDDSEYALLSLAARPMALPPFPISRLRR